MLSKSALAATSLEVTGEYREVVMFDSGLSPLLHSACMPWCLGPHRLCSSRLGAPVAPSLVPPHTLTLSVGA